MFPKLGHTVASFNSSALSQSEKTRTFKPFPIFECPWKLPDVVLWIGDMLEDSMIIK